MPAGFAIGCLGLSLAIELSDDSWAFKALIGNAPRTQLDTPRKGRGMEAG